MNDIDPIAAAADRGPSIVAVAGLGIALPTVAVALRFWSRTVASTLVHWWDDWAILLTVVFSHAFLSIQIYMTTVGLGKHSWTIPMENLKSNITTQRIGLVLYTSTIWGIKISALLMYARLFFISKRFVMVLRITGAISTIWWIIMAIYPWTFCDPIAKNVDPMLPGICWENRAWYFASCFINAFLDLAVLVLPIPVIWRTRMTRHKKLAVTMVLLLGYCSAFLSFARFIVIMINPDILSVNPPADPSWDLVPLLYLSMLEGPIAILALCGPAIHQLASRAINHGSLASLFTSRDRGTKPRSGDSRSIVTLQQASFSTVNDSQDLRPWPPVPSNSSSSRTAIVEVYNQKDSDDWQKQSGVAMVPVGHLFPSRDGLRSDQREKHMV